MLSGDLDKWRTYFRGSSSNIFDVIENAILIAALDHPLEFKIRKEQIVFKLLTCNLVKCSLCEGDLSKSNKSLASASANESRLNWSKSLPGPDFVPFKHYEKGSGSEIIPHSHVASWDGLSISLESNYVTQQQSVVGPVRSEESEKGRDYQDSYCSIEGVKTLVKDSFAEEESVGFEKLQECNNVVNRKSSLNANQVDYGCFAEALALVNKEKDTVPIGMHEELMPLQTQEHEENLKSKEEHFTFVPHDDRQGRMQINRGNEEAEMYKVNCMNGCTFSEVEAPVHENVEENHLINGNEVGGYYTLEIDEDNEILKEAIKINEALRNSHPQDDLMITELLQKLLWMDLNIQILQVTMIGETVTALKKHGLKHVRKHARALIRKWRIVVAGWIKEQAASSGDKFSENCPGVGNFVSANVPGTKETPVELYQEYLPCGFFNGGVPATPTSTPVDLLKLFEDVDEKDFFSILPDDDTVLVMESVKKEQDSTQMLSLIQKKQDLKLPENTQIGPAENPDRNGIHSLLEKERNDIQPKRKSSSCYMHNRAQLHQTGDLGKHKTSESDRKGKSIVADQQQQLKQNVVSTSWKIVERVGQAKDCNEFRSKLKSSLLETQKREQINESGDIRKRIISECDRKGKGAIDVKHHLKQNTVKSLHGTIEKAWQAKECKDVQLTVKSSSFGGDNQNKVNTALVPVERAVKAKKSNDIHTKVKPSSVGTHKRRQLIQTDDLEKRITSDCDRKAKQNIDETSQMIIAFPAQQCNVITPKLKSSSLAPKKRAQLSQTGDLGNRIASGFDLKAKCAIGSQPQLKQNTTLNMSQANHQSKLKKSEDVHDLKFEEARRKLRAGYQDVENAKKRRAVQVIDIKDLKTVNRKQWKKQHI